MDFGGRMNEIDIVDIYGYQDYEYLNLVIEKTLKLLDIKNVGFSVILTDDEEVKRLNKEYRGINKTTDVLSFAFEDSYNICYNEFRLLGDIYISISQMKKQAKEYQHSEKRELSFLTVHGLLHLLGYDHQNLEDEKKMFKLQEMILG